MRMFEKTPTMSSLDLVATPTPRRSLSFVSWQENCCSVLNMGRFLETQTKTLEASDQSTPSTGKTQRMTTLSEDQKADLLNMSKASDMDPAERKRQYSALRRAIYKDAAPALVAKDGERFLVYNIYWSLFVVKNNLKLIASNDHVRCCCYLRFGMMKQWMANPELSSITVEEKYFTFVENLRTDRYVTVS